MYQEDEKSSHAPELAASTAPEVDHSRFAPEVYRTYPVPSQYREMTPDAKGIPLSRRKSFWIILVLALLLVAAAIGGGLGASFALKKARSQSTEAPSAAPSSPDAQMANATVSVPRPAETAPTFTSATLLPTMTASPSEAYVPIAPIDVPRIDNSCPRGVIKSMQGERFKCMETTNQGGDDWANISAYTIQDCINACSSMNVYAGNTTCFGVALSWAMRDTQRNYLLGNCFLKKGISESMLGHEENTTMAVLCTPGWCA